MRVLCIRHGDGPEDDRMTSWCRLNGVTEDLAGVVVYGGMYNACDSGSHPFPRGEYRLIEAALAAETPLPGLCQGPQMLAHALGAWAGAPRHGNHEFGYCEISPTEAGRDLLPRPLHLCQAHFHSYDLPDGAELLARSALFEQQAFRHGRTAYAFQFHAETTIEGFRRWQTVSADYGQPGARNHEEQEQLMLRHDRAQAQWFHGFLDRPLGTAGA